MKSQLTETGAERRLSPLSPNGSRATDRPAAVALVVIAPEHEDPREIAVLGDLFASGLKRYHLRRPHASSAELDAWLTALPDAWRPRIVLHQHHHLVERHGLGGVHWRDTDRSDPEGRGVPAEPRGAGDGGTSPARPSFTSRSCHDLTRLRKAFGTCDAVFFGPLFSSLSKPGYGPRHEQPNGAASALLAARTASERRTAVFALGGITAATAPRALALGFDGVGVLGAVWHSADPVRAFCELQSIVTSHVS